MNNTEIREIKERFEKNRIEWRELRAKVGDFICHIDGTVHGMESEMIKLEKAADLTTIEDIQTAVWRVISSLKGNELMFIFNSNNLISILAQYPLMDIVEMLKVYDSQQSCLTEGKEAWCPKFKSGDIVQNVRNQSLILTVQDVVLENYEEFFWAEVIISDKWAERKFEASEFTKIGECKLEEDDNS